MSEPSKAVFISYASEDADAAARIAEALKAAGLEVWFDKNELRGGDAWDRHIREQIQTCRLFIALISANSNARDEGYFRREWRLAIDRTLDMDENKAFLFPVVIDGTSERAASVPTAFRQVQWTRLLAGETSPQFVSRIAALAEKSSVEPGYAARAGVRPIPSSRPSLRRRGVLATGILAVAIAACAAIYFLSPAAKHKPAVASGDAATSGPFIPPPHSLAVLAFDNLSGDPKEEYFADGLAEELINALVRISELQVAARTSSFSFKRSAKDVKVIGRMLNVGSVLEGSVRRAGSRLRITAQLINSVTGFHSWSATYDREFTDIIALQTDIATSVATNLQVTVLSDQKKRLLAGNTSNASAFDAYLRGRRGQSVQDEAGLRAAAKAMDEAIALDPGYANAYGFRGWVLDQLAEIWVKNPAEREELKKEAVSSVEKAVAMAPLSAEAHSFYGQILASTTTDYARIDAEYRRSVDLEPGNSGMLAGYADHASRLGRADAIPAARRAVVLNPLSLGAHANLGTALFYAGRHSEAREELHESLRLGKNAVIQNWLALNELADEKPAQALKYCTDRTFSYDQQCMAMAHWRLNRRDEARTVFQLLQKEQGDGGAYVYAQVLAYWNQPDEAMKWLQKAVKLHDTGLGDIKADPFMNPLRSRADFQAIVSSLGLPS